MNLLTLALSLDKDLVRQDAMQTCLHETLLNHTIDAGYLKLMKLHAELSLDVHHRVSDDLRMVVDEMIEKEKNTLWSFFGEDLHWDEDE